ncbi:ubiquitin specific protease 2 isoform X1 [Rhodnius prolixus]|uniref:Ubiquitin carboxyl-terminal hydrolase n=2 Tax=Rhodnius TaxID=13248 RepID=A0A0P4VPJ2_9HEMI
MPCSAVTVDYRRDSPTMPVPVARKILDGSEYSRLSYNRHSSSCTRRTSTTTPSFSSDTLSKYTIPRAGVGNRSNSITEDLRDRSQTRESLSTRPSRDSSRTRSSSTYSTDSFTKSRKPTIYTTFDLNEFRNIYAPSSYIAGTLRSSSEFGRPPRPSIDTTTSSSKYRSSSILKEKRSEPTENTNLEVNNIRKESTELINGGKNISIDDKNNISGDKFTTSLDLKADVDSSSDKDNGDGDITEDVGNLSPRHRSGIPRKDSLSSNSTTNNGLSGLRNIGNTCFLNSVVQCLSNTRILKDYLLRKEFITEIRNSESRGALIKSFAEVVTELWSGEGKIINPSAFKSQVQRYAPRFMGYNQQDAQEFLRYLLEGLHDDINRVQIKPKNLPEIDDHLSDSVKSSESWKQYLRCDNSRIVDLFVGQLKSTLQCTTCGHSSTTFEVFWDLSLPLPSRIGSLRLSQCLDHFTKEEVLDGDEMPTCSKCKTRRKCTKRFSIQKFPKILVLHLKRFSPSERYRKLTANVEFPLTNLDMSAYSSTPQACSYNLYAVSNHSGTTHSGHYTAYCLHAGSGQWYEFNDSRVTSISPRNVVSNEAYILFYEQSTGVTTSRL